MEYLMTYGWAILIIAVVLGALYSLGVFNGFITAPRAPPGSCHVLRPNGPLSTLYISLEGVCSNQLPQYVGVFAGGGSGPYVSVASASSLNLVNPYSISMWVYDGNVGSACGWLDKGYTTGGYMLWQEGGAAHMNLYVNFAPYTSPPTPPQNIWVLFTITVDSSGNAIWYTNAAQQSTAASVPSPTGNSVVLRIGSEVANRACTGRIANVQIYNTSLSSAQVQALYLEGIGGAPQELKYLVGWWPLNGNATDYSGDYNNGQIQGNIGFISSWTAGYTPP